MEPVKEEPEKVSNVNEKLTISPALQETDSSLLESIVSQPPISLDVKLEETAKELGNVKIGTKVADSILQKFNSIKKSETKSDTEEKLLKPEEEEQETITKVEEEKKSEFKFELPKEEIKHITAESELPEEEVKSESAQKVKDDDDGDDEEEEEVKPVDEPLKKPPPVQKPETDSKKRRKVLSRAFIEETDSDSSDSEQLVIARSDDDSQTNSLDTKPLRDPKESDSSNLFAQMQTTDDSQSQEERNFKFDMKEEEKETEKPPVPLEEEEVEVKAEAEKEEETDPQLHSLLLCEEEIPRSPAPPSEPVIVPEVKPKSEMPFASAPGTSCNNKSMLLDQPQQKKVINSPVQMERESRVEASTVLDNTPPTTPESTISNLSPRG